MEKLNPTTDGASPDITADNIDKLRELFPDAFTEGSDADGPRWKVDFDALKQILGEHVEDERERYSVTWHGKARARRIAQTPSNATLRPCPEESVNWDTTQNLFIEGDNLEVLKLLQKSYHKQVKMIYIDPPYNTGSEFIYPDRFQDNLDTYLRYTGQVDAEGLKVSANTESSGRYHTNWLNMMYPRLRLARNLLRDDGVIFVSIDDNEASNLKLLLDEIFGEENHLATHYVQVRFADKTLAEKNNYQKLVEQVFIYQKLNHAPRKKTKKYDIGKFCWKIKEKTEGTSLTLGGKKVKAFSPKQYDLIKVSPSLSNLKETWATGSILKANASGKFFGDHLAQRKNIDGLGYLYKVDGIGEDGFGFRYFTGPKKVSAFRGKFYSGVPLGRRKEIEDTGFSEKQQPIENFYDFSGNFGNCRHEGNVDFRNGKKPVAFLSTLINQAVEPHGGEIVLDFFAGSASTGHAVYDLNESDNGNRRFILTQLPEKIDSENYLTIADLAKKRLQNSLQKIQQQNVSDSAESTPQLNRMDRGFRCYELSSSNIAPWIPDTGDDLKTSLFDSVDNIRSDRQERDVLAELLLKFGLDLAVPIEERDIACKTVHVIGAGALVVCLADQIDLDVVDGITALKTELGPEIMRVVFKDSGFADDVVKTNAVQRLRQAGIDDVKSL